MHISRRLDMSLEWQLVGREDAVGWIWSCSDMLTWSMDSQGKLILPAANFNILHSLTQHPFIGTTPIVSKIEHWIPSIHCSIVCHHIQHPRPIYEVLPTMSQIFSPPLDSISLAFPTPPHVFVINCYIVCHHFQYCSHQAGHSRRLGRAEDRSELSHRWKAAHTFPR